MDAETFRRGLLELRTRRLGSVGEMLVQRLLNLGRARSLFHDLYDDKENKKVEVKFSVANNKHEIAINEKTVLTAIELAAKNVSRVVTFSSRAGARFDCNIQQIKRIEFDVLYYGICFYDVIVLFRITSTEISREINYSDKQHKGNKGEGQFHVNERTLQTHLDKYHYKTLTYDEFLALLQ